MKVLAVGIITSLLAGLTAFAAPAEQTNLKTSLLYYIPSDDDVWDNGYGADVQLQFWQSETFGLGLSIGIANWDLAGSSTEGRDFVLEEDGSATLIPIGGSVLFRPAVSGNATLTLEAGIRYVIIEADADVDYAVATSRGFIAGSAEYDADDAVMGLVQADLEFPVNETASLFVGAGFQFDIDESEASVNILGEEFATDVEGQAFFIRVGAIIEFQ